MGVSAVDRKYGIQRIYGTFVQNVHNPKFMSSISCFPSADINPVTHEFEDHIRGTSHKDIGIDRRLTSLSQVEPVSLGYHVFDQISSKLMSICNASKRTHKNFDESAEKRL